MKATDRTASSPTYLVNHAAIGARIATFVLVAALAVALGNRSMAETPGSAPRPVDATVAPDGSANFRTIQDAIDAAPQDIETGAWVIHVAPGTYHERINIQREKRHVVLRGDAAATTKLTFSLNALASGPDGRIIGTFRTPTLQIDADDFRLENLTVENSAGPGAQALAIRVDGDRIGFAHCHFIGWQDTILLNRGRQRFDDCRIDGAIDFIFGGATAWFERCEIVCVGNGYITAASTPADSKYGFVFDHCTIRGANPAVRTYLGRPWRKHASTFFLNCDLGAVVRPQGWHDWNKPDAHGTIRYGGYGNRGPGADPTHWPSWLTRLDAATVAKLTPDSVLGRW